MNVTVNITTPLKLIALAVLSGYMTLATAAAETPRSPDLDAKSYLLADFNSGQVIAQKDADKPVEPASITKLMSAYLVFEALANGSIALDEQVTVSEKAWRMGGSKMFIEVGKQVSVADLLKGMIVQSGNDATIALAEHVAGSEEYFVQLMNRKASEIGLENSRFQNTTGWPADDHFMSARDIFLLSHRMIADFPDYYQLYKIRDFTYNNIPQKNRNLLLWRDDAVDGIKTGHTQSAGYCLVSSALRDGMRLISVVIGAESEKARADQSLALLNYGYRHFETSRLYSAGEQVTELPVWKGKGDSVTLGLARELVLTYPRGRYDELTAGLQIPGSLQAPIEQGSEIGYLEISLDSRVLAREPLLALQTIEQAGFFKRLSDSIKQKFSD